ncbi:MAG: hypothetical protein KA163_03100 [Bacteroidia bacterium]|nr:hypothetical protein [Bacteroidia bacterium]
MVRLTILSLIFFTLLSISGCRKKYAISGRVISYSTSQPRSGIEIHLNQCLDSRSICQSQIIGSSTTNENGEFFINGKFRKKGRFYISFDDNGKGYHIDVNDINDSNILITTTP